MHRAVARIRRSNVTSSSASRTTTKSANGSTLNSRSRRSRFSRCSTPSRNRRTLASSTIRRTPSSAASIRSRFSRRSSIASSRCTRRIDIWCRGRRSMTSGCHDGTIGYPDQMKHGETGQGSNDYDAIFRILRSVNFAGWISVEDGMDGLDELRRSVEFLKRNAPSTTAPSRHHEARGITRFRPVFCSCCGPKPRRRRPSQAAPVSCFMKLAPARFAARRRRHAARACRHSRRSKFRTRSLRSTRASSATPPRCSRTTESRIRSRIGGATTRWPPQCGTPWCGGFNASRASSARPANASTSIASTTATPIRRAA